MLHFAILGSCGAENVSVVFCQVQITLGSVLDICLKPIREDHTDCQWPKVSVIVALV